MKKAFIIVLCLGVVLGLSFLCRHPFQETRVIIENVREEDDISPEHVPEQLDTAVSSTGNDAIEDEQKSPRESKDTFVVNDDKRVPSVGVVDRMLDFGHRKVATRTIDTIIIHSSYDALGGNPFSVEGIIEEYQQSGVAAHYLIDRGGVIYRLVADRDVAYHAGVSSVPDGRSGVNEFSLGIEMVNTKNGEFTDKQYASLNGLIASLKNKYEIKYVLGHNQIAPGRKDDPWNLEWKKVK